ncbi:hypothetical protein LPJ60_002196 [Coemansia sp. RSA 2675]|nr:hypothetical protein LPJ60_002196 [Coemansia sp. RSA 2675]
MAKVRQGFQEKSERQLSGSEQAQLYRQGRNTLGFLKLACEPGSVERGVVDVVLRIHKERNAAEVKPGIRRRRLQALQMQAYDSAYRNYDTVISGIARELDIILPQDTHTRSLEWIPQLKRLHKGDPALENTNTIENDV